MRKLLLPAGRAALQLQLLRAPCFAALRLRLALGLVCVNVGLGCYVLLPRPCPCMLAVAPRGFAAGAALCLALLRHEEFGAAAITRKANEGTLALGSLPLASRCRCDPSREALEGDKGA